MLTRLLDALSGTTSLQSAARALGVSYRFAWGLLGEGARALGAPLVEMVRGRGARMTPMGRKVLEADALVRSALAAPLAQLSGDLSGLLGEALPRRRPRLAMRASHDLALTELARLCAEQVELEIEIRGADESLAALARGQCDLAGFHVADALPRAAAAAAALGRWLDPRTHQLVNFVSREQGLIIRPGARIRGVHDLARPGVRFVDRQPPGSARDAAHIDLQVAAAVAEGRADAGFGLRAAASRYGLDFVPLATERYFLAGTRATLRGASFQAVQHTLRNREFARVAARLPGYDASRAGERESLAAALSWLGRSRHPAE